MSTEPVVDLSIAEWAVLGIVAEGQTHGFAVAREFTPKGALGKIWTLPRPLVYRAIAELKTCALVESAGSAPGDNGPQRTLLRATDAGKQALQQWLEAPIEHIRDARSHLIVKLLLLHRAKKSPKKLIARQRSTLGMIIEGLGEQASTVGDFDLVITKWRLANARALDTFLSELEQSG